MFCVISDIFLYSLTIVQFSIIFPVSYETISLLIIVSPLAEDSNYLTIFFNTLISIFFSSYFFPILLPPPFSLPLPCLPLFSPPFIFAIIAPPFPLSLLCPQFPRSLNPLYKLILVRSWQRNCSE